LASCVLDEGEALEAAAKEPIGAAIFLGEILRPREEEVEARATALTETKLTRAAPEATRLAATESLRRGAADKEFFLWIIICDDIAIRKTKA
jgi:ribosomal protein L16/L10AE